MRTARTETRATRRSLVAQVPRAVRRFLSTESAGAALLLAATVVALAWANSPWSDAYVAWRHTEVSVSVGAWALTMDVEHWVNDGLMALFFFVVGLEVRREFSVGELRQTSRARIPVLAAVGGVLLPALLFALLAPPGTRRAWGVVVGTDTAFMLAALAVVGPRFATQLRIFLLTLTVIDDIVAVGVIGFAYSDAPDVGWVAVMVACGGVIWALCRAGQWRVWPYAVAGMALWYVTWASGLHAAIAGMLGGLLVGAYEPPRDVVERAAGRFRAFRQSPDVEVGRDARLELERAISVNERLQLQLHPWASYVVVPVFALVNAGVDLRGGVLAEALASPLTWAVAGALVVGKTVGIAGTALGAARLRVGVLPQGVRPEHVVGGAALSGIGFTVSLLIAGLAFDDGRQRAEATVGVLIALVVATLLGAAVFRGAAWITGQPDADLPRVLDRPVDPAVDHVRGDPDAPLTLVEYGDFECPYCARTTGVAEELRAHFGPGLRYVFRHLPLTDVHAHAFLAARAALAADRQGRFWDMHDELFAHQSQLELEDLAGYAAALGLDVEAFLRDLEDPAIDDRIRSDVASAEASGARGTPTFFVGERRHTGPHDTRTLVAALEAARARVPTTDARKDSP